MHVSLQIDSHVTCMCALESGVALLGTLGMYIVAFDTASGEIKWEAKRQDTGFTHSTPVIAKVAGKPQMFVAASGALQGLDPANGAVLWSCAAPGDAASPAFDGKVVYSDSGRGGKAVCVAPTGEGDVTRTHLKWTFPQIPEGLSSAICVSESPGEPGGNGPATARVFRTHNPEILKCLDLDTGELVFSERLPGVSTWASPFATPDGRIYFASAGRSYVIKAGPKPEVLAMNEIGEENRASAAVSTGRIFIRGNKNLFCIGSK